MKLKYQGPPVFVVELDREVEDGEVLEDAPDALASTAGFEPVGKGSSSSSGGSGSGDSSSSSGGGDK